MSDPRAFRGVWIPASVWLDKTLSLQEKVMLVEIDSLCADPVRGCFKRNQGFAEFFGLSKGRVSEIIKSLEHKGYIRISYKREGQEIIERNIFMVTPFGKPNTPSGNASTPFGKYGYPPSGNTEESNTSMRGSREGETFGTSADAPSGSAKPNKSKSIYPPEFEWIWSHKPERAGGNGKKSAYNACRARIKSGATWRELAEGLKRYHTHCTAEGKIGTPYVMQMATFFGPDEHYKNDWKIGATNGRSTQQRNSGDEFLNALQSTDWINDYGKTPFDFDAEPAHGAGCPDGQLVTDGNYPDFPEVARTLPDNGGSGWGSPGVAHDAGGAGRDE